MKQSHQYILIGILFSLVSSVFFLLTLESFKEGSTSSLWLSLFLVSALLHGYLYVRLIKTKRLSGSLAKGYIPVTIAFFFVFLFTATTEPWAKEYQFTFGPDPFSDTTIITSMQAAHIWEREFWSTAARQRQYQEQAQELQTARQGSLIAHVGDSLRGWSATDVRHAFGEPSEVIVGEKEEQIWMYHPWSDHPDWEMPVHMHDDVLWQVGD